MKWNKVQVSSKKRQAWNVCWTLTVFHSASNTGGAAERGHVTFFNDVMFYEKPIKWLIRYFPGDLDIKRPILAIQISSLFDSELRTPSLVYAKKFGLAFEVKLRLCLMVCWGSEGMPWMLLLVIQFLYLSVSGLSSQTESNVNDLLFGQH